MTFSDSFELDKLSVQQLKEIIKSANLSFEGCLEKPELLNRAKKAVAVIQDLSKDISSAAVGEGFQNLHTELKLFGSYNCIVAGITLIVFIKKSIYTFVMSENNVLSRYLFIIFLKKSGKIKKFNQ
jgi:hypothetical protein